jgi:ribosomal protein RSM22 (predicted rRNA methylase)
MSLPPAALRAAIARELEGRPRAGLAERTAATTAHYRAGRTSAAAIRDADDALAYALARLPATYAATAAAFAQARAAAPGFAPASLLDAGSGPGGGAWAAVEAWPSLAAVTWLDASGPFLALARRLAAGTPLAQAEARRGDLTAAELPRADLVLASYALAEIAEPQLVPLALRLWAACDGVLALVEPGTPAGFARLAAARTALIEAGARVLAPCPHAGPCPLSTTETRREGFPGWCHFAVRLPRSRDHRLAKGGEVPFEDEKFAYLIAARAGVAAEPAGARVLSRPRAGKPGLDLSLCGREGLERRFVPRRDKAAHAAARRADWGDAI